jgi:nuclear pore complex protein Nup205
LYVTAERQLSSYPGLTRGLVAVLLYYDGRKALCDTLCLLAQARRGVSWQFNTSPEVSNLVASITDQLVTSNLIGNILGKLTCNIYVFKCCLFVPDHWLNVQYLK